MKSVVSYENRGKWGKSSWRGNTSGHIIVDIIDTFKPELFVDVCEGSGTSGDVCRDLNVDYVGLDLHKGNDFTKDYVLNALNGREGDVVFSHPPYHDMIQYMEHANDTSRCNSVEEFLEKSQLMLLNQREATKNGQYYMTLIGDHRKNGEYRSYQSDFINMMPKDELHNVIIKMQHNMHSNQKAYSGKFVPIVHEYLLVWKKQSRTIVNLGFELGTQYNKMIATTWRNVIRLVMMKLGKASLEQIYNEVERVAHNLIASNKNWKAKIRQKLQVHYSNVERGVWAL